VNTRLETPGNRVFLVCVVAALVVLSYVGYTALAAPRPYYMTPIDSEQDYYYNARLIAAGLPGTVHHPGTPVYYLGRVLLAASGDELAGVQRFFTLGYLVAGLLTAGAILAWGALVLRRYPWGIAALALALLLGWMPYLTYLSFFGADSFIVAVGLPTLALFWRAWEDRAPPRWTMPLAGVGIGLCLAVKMSFLPLVLALVAAYACHLLLPPGRRSVDRQGAGPVRRLVRGLAPAALGAATAYAIAIGPVMSRVPLIWYNTLTRPDAFPQDTRLDLAFGNTLTILARARPLWLMLLGAVALLAIVGVVQRVRSPVGRDLAAVADEDGPFDLRAAGVLLALLLAAFFYTGAAAVPITPGAEPGIHLRNMSPVALALPFLPLYAYRAWWPWSADPGRSGPTQLLLTALALIVLVPGVGTQLRDRARFVAGHARVIAATKARLARLATPGARIAFWTESSQDYAGEASFHFWGNYRYANHHFDPLLLRWFPDYTLLRLRNIRRMLDDSLPTPPVIVASRYGRLGDLYWAMRRRLFSDREHYSRLGGMLAGGDTVAITALAFPTEELDELPSMTATELQARVEHWFGPSTMTRESVGGIDWLFYTFSGPERTRLTLHPRAERGS
jgi:hypothetical protein